MAILAARSRGDTPRQHLTLISIMLLITSFELIPLLQNLAPILSGEVHKAQRRHTEDGGTRRDYVAFFQTTTNYCKRLALLK